jgi:predicted GIY-YIG superfamily endonuclease
MDVEDLDLISSSFGGPIAAAAKAEKARVLAGGKRTGKKPPRRNTSGFVYLISGSDGVYKIGRTSSIRRRMDDFTKLPFETALICTIPTPDALALESSLHKKFAMKRLNGEWFRLSDEDVAGIKAMEGDSNA